MMKFYTIKDKNIDNVREMLKHTVPETSSYSAASETYETLYKPPDLTIDSDMATEPRIIEAYSSSKIKKRFSFLKAYNSTNSINDIAKQSDRDATNYYIGDDVDTQAYKNKKSN